MAAVDKIKDQRKPEDFIGHRNRKPVLLSAKVGIYILNGLLMLVHVDTSIFPLLIIVFPTNVTVPLL